MLVAFSTSVRAQIVEDTLRIYFHKESAIYNRPYRDNEARAEEFFAKFNALNSVSGLATLKVETVGVASPEGDPAFNEIISKARMAALRRVIRSKVSQKLYGLEHHNRLSAKAVTEIQLSSIESDIKEICKNVKQKYSSY